jgi:hypothetical protein
MPFPADCYDLETLQLMGRALDGAWGEAVNIMRGRSRDLAGLRTIMAIKIMTAVRAGERDLGRLTRAALEAIDELS